MNEMNHDPNTPQYPNFRDFLVIYFLITGCIKSMNLFLKTKEPKLTIKEGIRIRTAFPILQNVLPRFYPNTAVNSVICWLKYQSNTKHSDEPFKDFFKMYNIGILGNTIDLISIMHSNFSFFQINEKEFIFLKMK